MANIRALEALTFLKVCSGRTMILWLNLCYIVNVLVTAICRFCNTSYTFDEKDFSL